MRIKTTYSDNNDPDSSALEMGVCLNIDTIPSGIYLGLCINTYTPMLPVALKRYMNI